MALADIVQIIISFLSLLATIVVSFSIYWLQKRHEDEIRKIEENQKQREFEEKAENFLFDNEEERGYLPYCIIAANMHRHEKHNRRIYRNFCRCSLELQNEILKQAGFTISMITDKDWSDECFDKLVSDIEKYQLGQDVLYEGAKYFHRGFERYRDEKFDFDMQYKEIIKPIYPSIMCAFSKNGMVDIGSYIEQYFDYVMKTRNTAVLQKTIFKPIDYVWESQNLSTCEEVLTCKWIMLLIKHIVINIHNRAVGKGEYDVWIENLTDAESETLEDEYYKIMYWIYATYYAPFIKNEYENNELEERLIKQCSIK